MRHLWLWELIEGPWPEMCTQFNELVRTQVQWTRATDTVATQYLNNQVRSAIGYKLEVQLRKTIHVACEYTVRFDAPNFAVRSLAQAEAASAQELRSKFCAEGGAMNMSFSSLSTFFPIVIAFIAFCMDFIL